MKGKIADINELIIPPIEKFGVLLYGPNEYRVNKNYIKIYDELNKHNDEMLEAHVLQAFHHCACLAHHKSLYNFY